MDHFSVCSSINTTKEYLHKKIIIVGAGIAGLSCARHLKEVGFTNVRVLEARNRIGGRIHTMNYGVYFIEMGAQWIHGQKGNIIYDLACSRNFVDNSAPSYVSALMKFHSLNEEECEVSYALLKYLDDKINNISEGIYHDSSVSSYLNAHFEDFVIQYSAFSQTKFLKEVYEWYCKILCELNGCSNLLTLSTKLLNNYKECEGLETVELKHGYVSILDLLLEEIPADWLLKCQKVTKIDWSEFKSPACAERCCEEVASVHKSVKVFCDKNVYVADHVIVTLPLGYLKKHVQSLFAPELCERKQKAISLLGFDVVNKIYLEFEEPFWEPLSVFNVLWHKYFEDVFNVDELCKNKAEKKCWVKGINRFAYTPSHPKMLCAWVVCEGAIIMESLSDKEVSEDCMKLLELVLDMNLPKPSRILRSSWLLDPFTCGSYSYLSVESEKENVSHLDISVPESSNFPCSQHPVLQFAGEATHPYYFSTVHGAYESGYREAERLYHHYRYSTIILN